MTYTLGQEVTFTHTLKRTVQPTAKRAWVPTTYWIPETSRGPAQGIVVGIRVLSDGSVDYGWDEPTVYTPDRHFTAYLVAYHLRRKPVLVLPDHLEPAPGLGGTDPHGNPGDAPEAPQDAQDDPLWADTTPDQPDNTRTGEQNP